MSRPPPAVLGSGRPSPLEQIRAYGRALPRPHWHFITFGFTELGRKQSPDLAQSGFGFELALRVERTPQAQGPPVWPIHVLNWLADYVFESRAGFGAFHFVPLTPLGLANRGSSISGLLWREDPELGTANTRNGRVRFLLGLGLTEDELGLIRDWNARAVLQELGSASLGLVTPFSRPSLMAEAQRRERIWAAVERDGSSTELEFVGHIGVDPTGLRPTLTFERLDAPAVARLLKGRTRFGRHFRLNGKNLFLLILPSSGSRLTRIVGGWHLELAAADADAWAAAFNGGEDIELPSLGFMKLAGR